MRCRFVLLGACYRKGLCPFLMGFMWPTLSKPFKTITSGARDAQRNRRGPAYHGISTAPMEVLSSKYVAPADSTEFRLGLKLAEILKWSTDGMQLIGQVRISQVGASGLIVVDGNLGLPCS